jgi:hypothetical protein
MAVGSAEGPEDGAADGISVNFIGSLSRMIFLFVRRLSCFASALSSLSSARTMVHVRDLIRSALAVGCWVGILLIGGEVGSLVGLVSSAVFSPFTHRTLFFSSEHIKLEQHFLRVEGPAPHSWALWSSLAHLSSSSWRDRRKWKPETKALAADVDADVDLDTRGKVARAVPSLIITCIVSVNQYVFWYGSNLLVTRGKPTGIHIEIISATFRCVGLLSDLLEH